jgi:hypothetical protein
LFQVQWFSLNKSCSSKARLHLQNSSRHHDLIDCNEIFISQRTMDIFMWRLLPDFTIWVTCPVSSEKQELLTFREHLGSPWFLVRSMLLIFLVFCVALCFFFVLCLVCPMLPVSLDLECHFLIVPWVFSSVYLYHFISDKIVIKITARIFFQ